MQECFYVFLVGVITVLRIWNGKNPLHNTPASQLSPADTITLFQNEPQTKWSNLLTARWPEPSGRPLIGGDQAGLDQ